jgi:hypothetical protein
MLPSRYLFNAAFRGLLGLGVWLCLSSLPRAMARQAPEEDADFFEMSLEDLANEPVRHREYKIKAAFLYNFLRTVDWPEGRFADGNEPWVIGIVGKDPFGDIFDHVADKGVKGRQVIIRRFPCVQGTLTADPQKERRAVQTDEWRKCHLLFVCRSEQAAVSGILKRVAGFSVLTVGEVQGFLESGGCINFIPTEDKGDFEINLDACKQAQLEVSSKLIRIAQRVIQGKK